MYIAQGLVDVLAVAEQAKGVGEGGAVQQVLVVCLRDSLTAAFRRDAEAAAHDADSGARPSQIGLTARGSHC